MHKGNSLITKLGISILSLFFSLTLLEIGLRVTGNIYSSLRSYYPERNSYVKKTIIAKGQQKKVTRILCLGDSYTFGGGVSREETYPSHLQKIFNQNNQHSQFEVINEGVCESNSKQVLLSLPERIKKDNPGIIILLVGAANRFNLGNYDIKGFNIINFFRNLRICKMAKIIYINLKGRILNRQAKYITGYKRKDINNTLFESNADNKNMHYPTRLNKAIEHFDAMKKIDTLLKGYTPYEEAWFYYNLGRKEEVLKLCNRIIENNPNPVEILCMLAYLHCESGNIEKAAALYNRALLTAPSSEFVLMHVAFFYNNVGYKFCLEKVKLHTEFTYNRESSKDWLQENRYDLAINFLCRAIEVDPGEDENYYMLVKFFELQSRYDASQIIDFFQNILKNNPGLVEHKLFMNYFIFFKNKEKWEKIIYRWLNQDLNEIANLCKEKGIKLVVQNYPYPYNMANTALKNMAFEHSLPFVDNCAVFNRLVNKEDWKMYFQDDEHCTPEGNKVVAKNAYTILSNIAK